MLRTTDYDVCAPELQIGVCQIMGHFCSRVREDVVAKAARGEMGQAALCSAVTCKP